MKVPYSGQPIAEPIPEGIENQIHEKGYRNKPLNEEQKAENKRKSRIRVRIEHVFGYMTGTMRGITVRSIGIARARFNIGLTNLVYNLCRYEILSLNCLLQDNYAQSQENRDAGKRKEEK